MTAPRNAGRAVPTGRAADCGDLDDDCLLANPANVEVYRRAGWSVVLVVTAEPLTIWIIQQSTG